MRIKTIPSNTKYKKIYLDRIILDIFNRLVYSNEETIKRVIPALNCLAINYQLIFYGNIFKTDAFITRVDAIKADDNHMYENYTERIPGLMFIHTSCTYVMLDVYVKPRSHNITKSAALARRFILNAKKQRMFAFMTHDQLYRFLYKIYNDGCHNLDSGYIMSMTDKYYYNKI